MCRVGDGFKGGDKMKENLMKIISMSKKNGTNLEFSLLDIDESEEINFEDQPKTDYDEDSVIIWEVADPEEKSKSPRYIPFDKILLIEKSE